MEIITFKIEGNEPLLLNNPRTVDPFDRYARAKKLITNKRKKTDDDLLELRRLEVAAKLYFDGSMGIYIPTTWITSAIGANSWTQCKIKRADIRSSVFPTAPKLKLHYRGMDRVKESADIANNPEFVKTQLLKQGQVRVAKCAPIFHDWSFSGEIEFVPTIIDRGSLEELLIHASMYGGWGDFRPTFGRARCIIG